MTDLLLQGLRECYAVTGELVHHHHPDPSDMQEFWGNLLGVEGDFDKSHPGIVKWQQPLKEVDRLASPEFDLELWLRVLGSVKNSGMG